METNTLKQFDLTGQVALISGGNRGLGLEMAKALADKILKENPNLRQVHSNASIRRMMEKHLESTLASHPGLAVFDTKVPFDNILNTDS